MKEYFGTITCDQCGKKDRLTLNRHFLMRLIEDCYIYPDTWKYDNSINKDFCSTTCHGNYLLGILPDGKPITPKKSFWSGRLWH